MPLNQPVWASCPQSSMNAELLTSPRLKSASSEQLFTTTSERSSRPVRSRRDTSGNQDMLLIPSVLFYLRISSLQVWEEAHKACHSAVHFSQHRGHGETAVTTQTGGDRIWIWRRLERHGRRTLSLATAGRWETPRKPRSATHSADGMSHFMNEQPDKYAKTLNFMKTDDVLV